MEYYWTLSNHGSNFGCSSGTTTHAVSTTTLDGNFSSIHPRQHPFTSDLGPLNSTYNPPADPLTCLKLGKRHYFQNDHQSLAAPNKKTKPYYSEPEGAPRCQVEGCGATLVNAKDYHRRHKVCETHAKSPNVTVRGIHQRFCQQCSRFHSVGEFDDTKRSCRRRLAGHNERRRKASQSQDHINNSRPDAGNKLGHTNFLHTTRDCALSLLSSYNNNNANTNFTHSSSSDLPAQCSAALRELIAENRACRQLTQLCSNQIDDHDLYTTYNYKLGSFIRAAGLNSGYVTTTTLADNSGFRLIPLINDADKNPWRDDEAAGCSEFWKSIDF